MRQPERYTIRLEPGEHIGWWAHVALTPSHETPPHDELPPLALELDGPEFWRPTRAGAEWRARKHVERRLRRTAARAAMGGSEIMIEGQTP